MKKFMDWFNSYKRYYIRGRDVVYTVAIFLGIFCIVYFVAYHHGWVDSFQLFDQLRPHRPTQG